MVEPRLELSKVTASKSCVSVMRFPLSRRRDLIVEVADKMAAFNFPSVLTLQGFA